MNKIELSNQALKNLLKSIELVRDADVKRLILTALENYIKSLLEIYEN